MSRRTETNTSNPQSRQIWRVSEAQPAEGPWGHAARMEDLAASGELIVSEALADPSLAKRVPVHEGPTLTTDGPFAEAKEQLAGFTSLGLAIERCLDAFEAGTL